MKLELKETIKVLDEQTTPDQVLEAIADSGIQDEAFFIMDIDNLVRKYEVWKERLPNVKPFYAVKCNDSPLVLQILASLGAGFDCASKGEISKILDLGVEPERIIFANPVKMASHIKYAAHHGVDTMTFDNHTELSKIKAYHPNAKLVLRIRVDDSDAQCPLGIKFGCDPTEATSLLKSAVALNLPVIGVSFHVGSGCKDYSAYPRAITLASNVIAQARAMGIKMTLLDIGGGFPGDTDTSISKIAELINTTLKEEFGPGEVEFIAEPGRYFVSSAYTLATCVHSVRYSARPSYYINDGVYGSFNCLLFENAVKTPLPLKERNSDEVWYESSVWGPTCDSIDRVASNIPLPRLSVGDWLVFRDMGAYTIATSTTFNGFPRPNVLHCVSQTNWALLKDILDSEPNNKATTAGSDSEEPRSESPDYILQQSAQVIPLFSQ